MKGPTTRKGGVRRKEYMTRDGQAQIVDEATTYVPPIVFTESTAALWAMRRRSTWKKQEGSDNSCN